MKTVAQKEANRINAAKRRREQPEHVAAINKKAYENGGRERQRAQRQRRKREDFFGYRIQFARRHNPALTVGDLRGLWESQKGLCALTGVELEAVCGDGGMVPAPNAAQLDHIIPVARGGSSELSNLRWVTARANVANRDLTDEEFVALCTNVSEWIGTQLLALEAERVAA